MKRQPALHLDCSCDSVGLQEAQGDWLLAREGNLPSDLQNTLTWSCFSHAAPLSGPLWALRHLGPHSGVGSFFRCRSPLSLDLLMSPPHMGVQSHLLGGHSHPGTPRPLRHMRAQHWKFGRSFVASSQPAHITRERLTHPSTVGVRPVWTLAGAPPGPFYMGL